MKKKILLILILTYFPLLAQVGIGTSSPTKELDVNGEFRVRTIPLTTNEPAAKDSVLVVDNLGNLKRISSQNIVNSYLKSAIKGSFSTSSTVSLNLISNKVKIPFDNAEFDVNSEFNTTTNSFVAKQNGIYSIKVQIKSTSAVGAATNFGVAIVKNGTVVSQNSYANLSVLSINVTPPIRSSETLVSLAAGDDITFNIVSDLLNVSILGTSEDFYFTIQQIR